MFLFVDDSEIVNGGFGAPGINNFHPPTLHSVSFNSNHPPCTSRLFVGGCECRIIRIRRRRRVGAKGERWMIRKPGVEKYGFGNKSASIGG